MVHCPAGCHEHPPFATDSGVSGSFVAPDHEYPSHIELRLTATDSHGASTTVHVDLEPKTATIDLASTPAGVPITVGNNSNPAPWSVTVIKGGEASISGPLARTIGGQRYRFSTWNGSHQRVRDLTVTGDLHLTATYVPDAQDSCASVTTNSPKQVAIAERSSGNDDADWFAFHIGHKRDVRITLDNLPVKGRLDLYKSCSNLLASSNNSGKQAETLKRAAREGDLPDPGDVPRQRLEREPLLAPDQAPAALIALVSPAAAAAGRTARSRAARPAGACTTGTRRRRTR